MLLGSFYKILSSNREHGAIKARVELNAEHAIFKGHFPGRPVVPGVCQLQMMEEILSQVLGKKLKLKGAAQIKFISFVDPALHPLLDVDLKVEKEENDSVLISGNYIWEQMIFLKFKGEFQ